MSSHSHFALALHILIALALHRGEPVPSATLAASVNTNPAFLRQLIGALRQAGLVETRLGKGGGALLARPAAAISLYDIYRATCPGPIFPCHRSTPDARCLVGRNILPVLDDVADRVSGAIRGELSRTSLAEVVSEVRERG